MSERPRVSVVVPVYNAGRFLHKCVESLLAQTYENIEIILVDDGSTDGSPEICDAFAASDTRVVVLHTENGGLSVARNRGVDAASGAYVVFVDADDYVETGYVAALYDALPAPGRYMSVCGVRFVDEAGNPLPPYAQPVQCTLNAEHALREMLYQRLFFNSAWGKLLRIDLARAHPFPPHQWYEDLATTYLWICDAGSVGVNTAPLYQYVQHAGSFMARAFTPARFTLLETSDAVYSHMEAHCPAVLPAARARRFAAYCQVLLATPHGRGEYEAERAGMRKTMRGDAPGVMRDRNCRKKDRAAAAAFRIFGERGLRLLWRAVQRGTP